MKKDTENEVKQFSLLFQNNCATLQGDESSETFTSDSKTLTLNDENYCSIACNTIPAGYLITLGNTISLIVEQISDNNSFILNESSTLDFCVENSSYRIQSSRDGLPATKIVSKVKIAEFIIASFDEGTEKCVSLDQNEYLILYNEYKNDDVFRDIFGYLSNYNYIAMINADGYSADNWGVIRRNQQDIYKKLIKLKDNTLNDDYENIAKSLEKVSLSSQKDTTTQLVKQDNSNQMEIDEEYVLGQYEDITI